MTQSAIKVGVITDQTGPLSFMGIANANVARMVIDDINAGAACSGAASSCTSRTARPTTAWRRPRRPSSSQQDQGRRDLRRHLQLDAAGHQGPGRRGGQDALHLPGAVRGAGVRPADLLHRPGAGAAGRAAHPLADAADGREEVLPAVGRLHLAARDEQEGARGRHGQRRRRSSARSTSRSITPTTARRSRRSCRAAPRWCSTRSFRPGSRRSSSSCTTSGFTKRGGTLVCTYFDENFLNLVPAEHVEGLYSCLDYYQAVERPVQPGAARPVRRALSRAAPSSPPAARARACTAA